MQLTTSCGNIFHSMMESGKNDFFGKLMPLRWEPGASSSVHDLFGLSIPGMIQEVNAGVYNPVHHGNFQVSSAFLEVLPL